MSYEMEFYVQYLLGLRSMVELEVMEINHMPISFSLIKMSKSAYKASATKCCNCFRCGGDAKANRRLTVNSLTDTEPKLEPLIQPTSTIIICNHGAENNEVIQLYLRPVHNVTQGINF